MNDNYQAAMNAPIKQDIDLPITMHDDETEELTAPLIGLAGAAVVLVAVCAVIGFVIGLLHKYF